MFGNFLPRFMHHSPLRGRNQNPNEATNGPVGGPCNENIAGPSGSTTSNKRRWMGDGSERQNSSTGDQQVCQVDNSKAVITKIAALYAERLMSDITLVINGVEYPAHRLILCASSDVFQVMLMNPNWSESQESRVVLLESVECAESFECFLKYLYTGILKLQLSNVMHLLMLADKYNVKDLITLCLDYMGLHIAAASTHHQLILWYQYMSNFGFQHAAVANSCRNYIKWNLELVAKSDDFPHLDFDLLVSILADDDIVVYDEFSLYRIVEDWLMYQIHKYSDVDPELETKMARLVEGTMSLIRFPLMSPRQLADLIPRQIVRKYSSLMEYMAIAMAFHNGELANFSAAVSSHPHNEKIFTPRLYCTDRWSVCIIAAFDRMQHYQSQTLVFSTPCSFAENFTEPQVEWCLDFYPKAVQFQRSFLIGWHGTIELPEHILKTVRLSVVCKTEGGRDVRVRIGALIAGFEDGVEHVRRVVRKNYIFSDRDRVLNLDDLIPYGDLNPCASCDVLRRSGVGGMDQSTNSSGTDGFSCSSCKSSKAKRSCFVVGSQVKVRIVITPLNEVLK